MTQNEKEELKNAVRRLFQMCARTNESYKSALRQLDDILNSVPDSEVVARIRIYEGNKARVEFDTEKYLGKSIELSLREVINGL